jgi:hypothetical protein
MLLFKSKLAAFVAAFFVATARANPPSSASDNYSEGCQCASPTTVTETCTVTDYKTITSTEVSVSTCYITVTGPTTTVSGPTTTITGPTITDYITKTSTVSIPGPVTTITNTETDYVTKTSTISIPGPTTTITNTETDYVTKTSTVSIPGPPGPTTTITDYVTRISTVSIPGPPGPTTTITNIVTRTSTVSVPGPPGPTTTISNFITRTTTVSATVTAAATTVVRTSTIVSTSTTSLAAVTRTIVDTVSITRTVASTTTATATVTRGGATITAFVTRTVSSTVTNVVSTCPPSPPPTLAGYCSPDQCKPAPALPLPKNLTTLWPNPTEPDCAWYQPTLGYFHFDPEYFNLTYAIFDVYGQPVCKVPAPTSTKGWSDWRGATPTPKLPRRGLEWLRNPLAEIVERGTDALLMKRQTYNAAPEQCYRIYDAANTIGQSVGKVVSQLCPATSEFQMALTQCRACAQRYAGSATGTDSFGDLQMFVAFCNANS